MIFVRQTDIHLSIHLYITSVLPRRNLTYALSVVQSNFIVLLRKKMLKRNRRTLQCIGHKSLGPDELNINSDITIFYRYMLFQSIFHKINFTLKRNPILQPYTCITNSKYPTMLNLCFCINPFFTFVQSRILQAIIFMRFSSKKCCAEIWYRYLYFFCTVYIVYIAMTTDWFHQIRKVISQFISGTLPSGVWKCHFMMFQITSDMICFSKIFINQRKTSENRKNHIADF